MFHEQGILLQKSDLEISRKKDDDNKDFNET